MIYLEEKKTLQQTEFLARWVLSELFTEKFKVGDIFFQHRDKQRNIQNKEIGTDEIRNNFI
jgi:hypothetical protein